MAIQCIFRAPHAEAAAALARDALRPPAGPATRASDTLRAASASRPAVAAALARLVAPSTQRQALGEAAFVSSESYGLMLAALALAPRVRPGSRRLSGAPADSPSAAEPALVLGAEVAGDIAAAQAAGAAARLTPAAQAVLDALPDLGFMLASK